MDFIVSRNKGGIIMDKICEYCGKEMLGVRSDKKYCSRSCSAKAQRERQK